MEFILNRSNSYKFYKEGYDSNKKKIKKLKRKTKKQNERIEVLESRLESKSNIFCKFPKDLRNLNIAYILNGFPIHSETFVINEIKWLKNNGYNVVVFHKRISKDSIELDFIVESKIYNNKLELERLLIEYDIGLMYTHFVFPICTEYTFPIAEELKIPFVVFAHAYDIFINENDEKNNIEEISKSKYCVAIFTLSNFHKDYLLERNVDETKIIITKQATEYEISDLKVKENPIINIISISRFVEKKGLDNLIEAAKLLEDEDFVFSIYGFGELEDDLQDQIHKLGSKNISIKGKLQPQDVKNVLKESDLLVSSCKVAKNGDMDGIPTIIFESMAYGLPVLTTNVSAIPEVIIDNENGFLIESDNTQALANKIKEISSLSGEELFNIRKKAQEDVKDISSVEKTMSVFLDTLNKWDYE